MDPPTTVVFHFDRSYRLPGLVADVPSAARSLLSLHAPQDGWRVLKRHLQHGGDKFSVDDTLGRAVLPGGGAPGRLEDELDMFTPEAVLRALGVRQQPRRTRGGCMVRRYADGRTHVTCTCLEQGAHHISHILELDADGRFVRGRVNLFDRWREVRAEDAYGLLLADALRALDAQWDVVE